MWKQYTHVFIPPQLKIFLTAVVERILRRRRMSAKCPPTGTTRVITRWGSADSVPLYTLSEFTARLSCTLLLNFENSGAVFLFAFKVLLKNIALQYFYLRSHRFSVCRRFISCCVILRGTSRNNKKSELMLTKGARAYSSFCLQVTLVYLHPFRRSQLFSSQKSQKNH